MDWTEDPSEGLVTENQWKEIGRKVNLTKRELDVAKELFRGRKRIEVAETLGIAESTVRHHLDNIYSKLQVSSRVGIALRLISVRDQIPRS